MNEWEHVQRMIWYDNISQRQLGLYHRSHQAMSDVPITLILFGPVDYIIVNVTIAPQW